MDEARASRRVSPLIIRAKFQFGEKLFEGYVTNLSETGAFLATEERTEVGESFGLILDMPWTLGEVTAEAEVVWRTDQPGRGGRAVADGPGSDVPRRFRRREEKAPNLHPEVLPAR